MEKEIEKIKEEIKNILTEERFKHSVSVMEKSMQLAKLYGIDELQAAKVGLTHDIAKEMSKKEILEYIKINNIKADDIELHNLGLLHGKIGADICKKRYGFTTEMCKAIENHTTGDLNMNNFDKIIYISDKIEARRTYEGIDELRGLAEEDLDKCMLELLNRSITKCIKKKNVIHPKTIFVRNKILEEI